MPNKYEEEAKKNNREKYENRDRRRKWLTCVRKTKFLTEEAAFQKNQEVYKCPYCDGWHRSGAFARLLSNIKPQPKTKSKKEKKIEKEQKRRGILQAIANGGLRKKRF